jgi:hypothetical protein
MTQKEKAFYGLPPFLQLNESETAQYSIQLRQNLTSDCLLIMELSHFHLAAVLSTSKVYA